MVALGCAEVLSQLDSARPSPHARHGVAVFCDIVPQIESHARVHPVHATLLQICLHTAISFRYAEE